jgi:hypothetical protein
MAVLALVIVALEVASFAVLRDRVRLDYLAGHFALSDVPVRAQWGMFTVFVLSLLAGLALLVVVTRRVAARAIAGARERWRTNGAGAA